MGSRRVRARTSAARPRTATSTAHAHRLRHRTSARRGGGRRAARRRGGPGPASDHATLVVRDDDESTDELRVEPPPQLAPNNFRSTRPLHRSKRTGRAPYATGEYTPEPKAAELPDEDRRVLEFSARTMTPPTERPKNLTKLCLHGPKRGRCHAWGRGVGRPRAH